MINDPLLVFATLAGVTALAVWLEPRSKLVRVMSSVLFTIVVAAVLSNTGVIPLHSPVYDALRTTGVPVAVTLILLQVNLAQLKRAGPRMLAAFTLACFATMVAALLAFLVFGPSVGDEAWKIAGMYTGTYTGGSVNFVALGAAFEASPGLFVAANAADNVATVLWLVVCLVLPPLLARYWVGVRGPDWREPAAGSREPMTPGATSAPGSRLPAPLPFQDSGRSITLWDVSALGLVTFMIIAVSSELGARTPSVPAILWVSTLALIAAQIPAINRLAGGMVVGNYALHLFLAAIGASAGLSEITRSGLGVLWFALLVVTVHGIILYGLGRLAKLDLGVLTVASQATVGGPPTAMAIAATKGWPGLVVPGVAAGLLGYAVGTYLGWIVATLAKGL
jgi:uncharacterized membrane protein